MRVITSPDFLQKEMVRYKRKGKSIGFVPTMGFLHEGHLSLIRKARYDCDVVVVSIFVNPTQFGPREDFSRYPRDLERDKRSCRLYVDILFCPSAKDMYPDQAQTFVTVEKLSGILCGKSRPGHFRGVTTIVLHLLHIVMPDILYLGQKDVQQAIIIKRMISDFHVPTSVKVLPIVREHDGLALSSRNSYLSTRERSDAVVLYRSLLVARDLVRQRKSKRDIILAMRRSIGTIKHARIDYIDIVNPQTLEPLHILRKKVLVLLAVFIGRVRLIDNMVMRRS